ncbi:MAG: class I SAM-dependent methyltransferase [Thermoanaerobaculia bacterium]
MSWERDLLARQAEEAILFLRELLVRFDENLKAHRLMESVPYWLDAPALREAAEEQREMVAHALDPAAYRDYYARNPHERPFEEQYGIDVTEAHLRLPRLAFLRERLWPGARVLDLSANDGAFAANLSLLGVTTDCLDLNPECIARARQRQAAFPNIGRARVGNLLDFDQPFEDGAYDAVVLFETIEHLADPAAGLRAGARFVKPGGSLYVSTPAGAVEDGNLPSWDHVEPKGHLWAFTPGRFKAVGEAVGEVAEFAVGADRVMVARVVPG